MKTSTVSFYLPVPPSTNRLWRCVRGRFIKSKEYNEWQRHAAMRFFEQRIKSCVFGRYSLEIHIPINMRGDADNRMKAANDFLKSAGVIVDDRLCKKASVELSESARHECLLIVTGEVAYKDQWEFAKAKADQGRQAARRSARTR